jgi:predicted transcriptional regulator
MRPPCEIMVQKVLPAIRVEIARLLMQEHGLQQQDIAKRLGVSKAAVSQYVSAKRGADTDFFDNAKEEIKDFAESVALNEDTSNLTEDFCNICKILQTEGWKRREQAGSSEYIVENCSICLKR